MTDLEMTTAEFDAAFAEGTPAEVRPALHWRDRAFTRAAWQACADVTGRPMTNPQLAELKATIDEYWAQTGDESLYGDRYIWPAFDCWQLWSRSTLRQALPALRWALGTDFAGTIVDVGGGIGLTTAQILQEFPLASGICTNLPSRQEEVARQVYRMAGVTDRASSDTRGVPVSGDAVIALEMLEHVHDPIAFIAPYLETARLFVDGSSFTVKAYGHWTEFAGKTEPKNMRRVLNRFLRSQGWLELRKHPGAPAVWNNRPAIWLKVPD